MERGQALNCLFNEPNIVDIYLFALPLQKAAIPRPLRVEFPNSWYQVMKGGRKVERIYHQEADCGLHFFISDLCYTPYQQITETFGVRTPSTISSTKARIKKRMENDSIFFNKIQKLNKVIKTI